MPTQDRKNLIGHGSLDYDKNPRVWCKDINPFSPRGYDSEPQGRPASWSGKRQNYDFYFYTDFEIVAETYLVPYHVVAPDYETAKSRVRASIDRFHLKDSNKEEFERLLAFIKHSKIRIDGQKNKARNDVLRDITDPSGDDR